MYQISQISSSAIQLYGRFGDALAEMDDAVGKILDFLYSIKAEENTIVFLHLG